MNSSLQQILGAILSQYQKSFSNKVYVDENNEHDLLMDIFSLTPETKRENRQYWGRELGMCWQLILTRVCEDTCVVIFNQLYVGFAEKVFLGD